MSIPASSPTVLEATYDKWAIADFRALGDGCVSLGESRPLRHEEFDEVTGEPIGEPVAHDPPVRVLVRLIKYRLRPDGASERSPHPGDVRQLQIDDLYAAAAADPDLAAAMGALTLAVVGRATAQGAL